MHNGLSPDRIGDLVGRRRDGMVRPLRQGSHPFLTPPDQTVNTGTNRQKDQGWHRKNRRGGIVWFKGLRRHIQRRPGRERGRNGLDDRGRNLDERQERSVLDDIFSCLNRCGPPPFRSASRKGDRRLKDQDFGGAQQQGYAHTTLPLDRRKCGRARRRTFRRWSGRRQGQCGRKAQPGCRHRRFHDHAWKKIKEQSTCQTQQAKNPTLHAATPAGSGIHDDFIGLPRNLHQNFQEAISPVPRCFAYTVKPSTQDRRCCF